MIIQKYNLNIVPDKVPVYVECSQYDKLSRTIVFTIYNQDVLYDIPTGSTAFVRGTKKDKTGFEYACTITGSDVEFDIEEQMTIFEGQVPCELRITNSGQILGTCNFILNVERSPLTDDTIISDTDMPLIQEASAAADRAEAAASQAESLLSTVVKKVNNVLPDSSGNVEITIPDVSNKMDYVTSPTANNILLTNASGQAIDSGKKLSDLQELLTAGTGIGITGNVISNLFDDSVVDFVGDVADLNTIITTPNGKLFNGGNYRSSTLNRPDTAGYGVFLNMVTGVSWGRQITISDQGIYTRKLASGVWQNWVNIA